jgi:hypothetical protein
MRRTSVLGIGFLLLMFLSLGVIVTVQQARCEQFQAGTAVVAAPVEEVLNRAAPPPISEQQLAQLEFWSNNTTLPGPILRTTAPAVGPIPGTESAAERQRSMEPMLPETPTLFRIKNFSGVVPGGYASHVMESSVATEGKNTFYTGNWFAARSTNGGIFWTHVDPFPGWPAYSPFCCDQVALPDKARTRFFWERMGSPGTNPDTGNYENVFKLSVSANGGATWWTYTVAPLNVNGSWTNQWWDYCHMQLAGRYLYIAWNMFNQAGSWTQSVMLRWPLDALAAGAGFSYNYYYSTSWFTFVPAQGCDHTMYWASNWPNAAPQNSRIAIWKWDEDTTTVTSVVKDVTAWTATGRGDAVCGAASGNWAARYDQRVLTGARYRIWNTNLKYYGRNVLGWWWNVAQGGSFPKPYIEGAAFFEDTLAQVPGNQGRPLVYNTGTCFAYPAASVNERGDVGLVINYSSGAALNPSVAYCLSDDYTGAPPGWTYHTVRTSTTRPSDNKWGDYNTSRPFFPSSEVWSAASHFLPTSTAAPIYFVFGRGRDLNSWTRWRVK